MSSHTVAIAQVDVDAGWQQRKVRKLEAKNGSKFGTSAYDRTDIDIAYRSIQTSALRVKCLSRHKRSDTLDPDTSPMPPACDDRLHMSR